MKKGVGLVELLFAVIVIVIIYFTCFNQNGGKVDPFADNQRVNTQKQMANEKIKEINETKALQEKMEKNLNEENQ